MSVENIDDYRSNISDELLGEIKEQREALKLMIVDLELIKNKIDKLFPESLDKRFIRFFEEKVKTATGIFNSILDMRKEITKSLKDEIEIRRKLTGGIDEDFDNIDIHKLASKIEKLNKTKDKLKEKVKNI